MRARVHACTCARACALFGVLASLDGAQGKGGDGGLLPQVVVKFGLNHVTDLIEASKAQLVIIAHDVDPIELVLWLPALCKKMNVPYFIVKVPTPPPLRGPLQGDKHPLQQCRGHFPTLPGALQQDNIIFFICQITPPKPHLFSSLAFAFVLLRR